MTQELQQKMQEKAENECWGDDTNNLQPYVREFGLQKFLRGVAEMYSELKDLVEWIDVQERWPEKGSKVLVRLSNGDTEIDTFVGYWFTYNDMVKFWRPIELK